MIEKKAQGGTGGGSADVDIVSTDETVSISKAGNTFDLSVDNPTVTSDDGTVSVNHEGNNYDLSIQLVTEEVDGLARAFDKKILDHSFANTAYMGSATKAAEAIETHVLSEDSQYNPEYGQILGWQDENGNLRLSRMAVPSWGLPLDSWWIDGCYDSVHGTLCIATTGDPSSNGYDGDFCIAVRRFDTGWKVVRVVNHEKWNSVCYGNGLIVITTGNSSNEFMWSSDGGYTWTSSSALGSGHWKRARYNETNGYFYFIASERIIRTQDLQTFSTYFTAPTGAEICDITWTDDNDPCYLYYMSGETYFRIGMQTIWHTPNFRAEKCIYKNGYLVTWYDGSVFIDRDNPNDNTRFQSVWYTQMSGGGFDCVDVFATSGGVDVFIASTAMYSNYQRAVRKVQIVGNSVVGDDTATFGDENSATHLLPCEYEGETCFYMFGGASFMPSTPYGAKKSKWGNLIKYDLSELPPQAWEEIPVLDEKADGLLCAINGEFTEVEVEKDYLKYTPGHLTANHSDRCTEYANYRLVENTTGDNPDILWTPVEMSNIVDNSTPVYDDESCTNAVGVITRHAFNPNNPNDVEVSIGGALSSFTFVTSKMPVSLATTKAVVDGLTNMATWIANNIFSGIGNAIWKSTDLGATWTVVSGVTYTAGQGFLVNIYNTVNDMVIVTNDGQQPAADRTNWVIYYQCVQLSGNFTTYLGCRYTDGNHTDALVLVV